MGKHEGFAWATEGGDNRPNKHDLVSILARCIERRLVVTAGHLVSIGHRAAKNWRELTKLDPYQTPEIVGKNTGAMVKGYPRSQLHVLDHAIDDVMNNADEPEPILCQHVDDVPSSLALIESEFGVTLRDYQTQALTHILEGKNTILHAPTGAGKSVVFQGASRVLSEKGITVVLYPIKALIADQKLSAAKKGLNVVPWYGDVRPSDKKRFLKLIEGDTTTRMLLTTPESIIASARLRAALKKRGVALVVVDEAHIFDEWAPSFRHAYKKLSKVIEELLHPPLFLCSATLTTTGAIKAAEGLKTFENWEIVQAPSVRPNLIYGDVTDDAFYLLEQALSGKHAKAIAPGIVFCAWAVTANYIVSALKSLGINVSGYTGKLKPKDRKTVQEMWTKGQQWVVATKAFGMGIDKADVRPSSTRSYHRRRSTTRKKLDVGGRDGKMTLCLLPQQDITRWGPKPLGYAAKVLVSNSFPSLTEVKEVWEYLVTRYRGVPVWSKIDPKMIGIHLWNNDMSVDTVRKSIAWLNVADMVDKKSWEDQWIFKLEQPTWTNLSVHDACIPNVMKMIRKEATTIGDAFVISGEHLDQYVAEFIIGSKGAPIKKWKPKVKRWIKDGLINGSHPQRKETHIIVKQGKAWGDFHETGKDLHEVRQMMFARFEAMLRIARTPGSQRQAALIKETMLDKLEFENEMKKRQALV